MTATDDLRAMLDERGVEWRYAEGDDEIVVWQDANGCEWRATFDGGGILIWCSDPMTPAQAMEATLGRGVR